MNKTKMLLSLLTFTAAPSLGYDNKYMCNHEHYEFVHDEWLEEIGRRNASDLPNEFPDPIIISLGFNCTPATYMRQNQLRQLAFPFDWMGCSLEGLCSLLENDFQDFLNPAYLSIKDGTEIIEPIRKFLTS